MLWTAHLLVNVAIAAGLFRSRLRRVCAVGLLAAALGCVVGALMAGDGQRELEIVFNFSAYVGNDLAQKDFPIETTRAGASAWFWAAGLFCALWAAALWVLRPRAGRAAGRTHPFWVPMFVCWTGCAWTLWLEKLAAPADLVRPMGFDRTLFPMTVTAALLLAERCRAVLLTFSWLSLFVSMSRIPIALFGTFATRGEWGTSLDVHSVEHFANPLVKRTVSVEPGSQEQLMWLIWSGHLLILPALYMMSTGGIALARIIVGKGAVTPERTSPAG